MSQKNQSQFQDWMDATDYTDIRFYPTNSGASSSSDILKSAYEAVKAHEEGSTRRYVDHVVEEYMD